MDKNETELDEATDTEMEEDTIDVDETEDDVDPDADTDVDDVDDEFEYDEDGNIIIPEVEEDDEGEGADAVEEEGETETSGEDTSSEGEAEVTEPDNATTESEEIATLRSRVKALEAQGRDTLAKLGVKTDDVLDGLATLAAEAEEIPLDEYKKRMAEQQRNEQAQQLLRQQEFERLASADLAELQAAYPETQAYKHIREFPDDIKRKFGQFRDLGLSAKEAYAAANPDGIRSNVATAVKKQSLHASKSHLRTAVPKGSKDHSVTMTKAELSSWRDMFPGKSDKEIVSLFRRTAK